MRYQFPRITHLNDVLEAIKGRDEFIVAERDGFTVVNYLVNLVDTFPTPDTKDPELNRLYQLRRECRGIIFCSTTGEVLARRYHKFSNVNERAETSVNNIDITLPHVILEKLDGSMITPFMLKGNMRWGTKMGLTDIGDQAAEYVEGNPYYRNFAHIQNQYKRTPIFEWCSRKQRIVIDYPEDMLILTAVREMESGNYFTYDAMCKMAAVYDIPVVQALEGSIENMQEFLDKTAAIEGAEGHVIRFDGGHMNGHMLKAKGEEYCRIHKTKELLHFEKDVWSLILHDNDDDAKAFMDDEDRDRIERFATDLRLKLAEKADELYWIVVAAKDNLNDSKKRFAIEEAPKYKTVSGILFKIWSDEDPLELICEHVKKNLGSSTKLESVRHLAYGIKWEDY